MTLKRTVPILLIAVIFVGYLWWSDGGQHVDATKQKDVFVSHIERVLVVEVASNPEPKIAVSEPKSIDADIVTPVIEPPELVPVQGRIINQYGHGVGAMQIQFSPMASPGMKREFSNVFSEENGYFNIDLMKTETAYRLEVLASEGYLGTLMEPFYLSSDMPAVEIILDSVELSSASGMILGVDRSPIANFEFLVANIGLAYPGRTIISDSSGFFQLDQFPIGGLQFWIDGDEHFKIDGVTLHSGEYHNLSLVVDKGTHQLSGWVTDEFGEPIIQAMVVLTSNIPNLPYRSSSYRLKLTDRNGSFLFSGLGGEGHQIAVNAIGFDAQVVDHHFQQTSDNVNIQLVKTLD